MDHNPGAAHAVAIEWADRCAALLSMHAWEHVSAALGELHDQLREDIRDAVYTALSQD